MCGVQRCDHMVDNPLRITTVTTLSPLCHHCHHSQLTTHLSPVHSPVTRVCLGGRISTIYHLPSMTYVGIKVNVNQTYHSIVLPDYGSRINTRINFSSYWSRTLYGCKCQLEFHLSQSSCLSSAFSISVVHQKISSQRAVKNN